MRLNMILGKMKGWNVWSLLFPGSQVSAKNTRATRLCSSCFTSQFQRNPNNGGEDAWEMLLSGAGICTNVLLSQLGSKSGLQPECVYLREGGTVQATTRKGTMRPEKKKRALPTPAFLPPPGSFQPHKGRHIFHIIAKHVCLLNYSLIS